MAVRRHHRRPQATLKLYLDSSAWAKVFVAEPEASAVDELWDEAEDVFCLCLGYLEVRSAIARRLPPRAARRARALLDRYWQKVETTEVDDRLLGLAARVVDDHRLRTLDALHLAAALDLSTPDLVVATWDVELRRAARAEGLVTAPV